MPDGSGPTWSTRSFEFVSDSSPTMGELENIRQELERLNKEIKQASRPRKVVTDPAGGVHEETGGAPGWTAEDAEGVREKLAELWDEAYAKGWHSGYHDGDIDASKVVNTDPENPYRD